MGEAKRRKLLDPGFGHPQVLSLDEIAERFSGEWAFVGVFDHYVFVYFGDREWVENFWLSFGEVDPNDYKSKTFKIFASFSAPGSLAQCSIVSPDNAAEFLGLLVASLKTNKKLKKHPLVMCLHQSQPGTKTSMEMLRSSWLLLRRDIARDAFKSATDAQPLRI